MSIWKDESVKNSEPQTEDNRTPFYEMTPSERSDAIETYSEWVDNQTAKHEYTIAEMEAQGFISSELALKLIGNIESYFIQVEFSGIIIKKVSELEDKLFTGIFEDVERNSPIAFGIEAIRESVYKTSRYKASLFTLKAIEFKAKKAAREAHDPKTSLDDHLEDLDTSDKEVPKTSSKKKGSK